VLRGESRGAHRDALLLGAALALEVSGRESALRAGVLRAAQAIDSGAAAALLERLRQFGRAHAPVPAASTVSAP
jgi:anthranilate phosphoribosyltransferase